MLALSACNGLINGKLFKERAAETPAPSEEVVDKSFFVDPSGKPKTFLCAWAPEMGRGSLGERALTMLVNEAAHCNLEFEITEHYLVGRMVQPSFPNDRSRWKEVVKIPIIKHYYYERAKDEHGRDTNQWIENDQRSHWSARPKMKLDLAGVNLQDLMFSLPTQISAVDDIEWDQAHNFLGFSIDVSAGGGWLSGELQGRYRVNFMKFEHDPTFKKTPFNQENSRYMNILHVMGRKIEGLEPELYAAHWDLRKTTKVYLNGVPKELEKDIVGAVYKWDHTLQEIGAVKPGQIAFAPVIKNLKHPFDLRYPSINWISDKRISASSPLGIGMAHADVRNGKILWGSVVLFGGILEKYINAYTPVDGGGGQTTSTAGSMSPFGQIAALMPTSFHPMKSLDQVNPAYRDQFLRNMDVDHAGFLNSEIARLSRTQGPDTAEQVRALRQQLADFQSNDPRLNKIVSDFIDTSHDELIKATDFFRGRSVQDLLGASELAKTLTSAQLADQTGEKDLAKVMGESNQARRQQLVKELMPRTSSIFFEKGMTAENMVGSWMNSPARQTRTYPEMLNSVVMNLALHEFGHFIGLGHQFKENIVPDAGTVPSRYIKALAAKATPEAGFTNFSTVMGYQSGRTEMLMPIEDLKPGPHDELVLRYLYEDVYAAYDKAADDFAYAEVPPSGKIPEYSQVKGKNGRVVTMRTSYFPACGDYEASLGADPFCNRWDRGSSAVDIVKSYFENLSDNLLANLYSLVGGGSNAQGSEGRMWWMALDSFSRVRLFYDEMRRRLRSEPQLKALWNKLRNDKDALFEFSSACQKDDPTNPSQVTSPVLRQIFADRHMVDLCRANAIALNEFRFFLNLPEGDYSKIDHNNRYISGGYLEGDATRNTGHMFGSWYQLSNLPLKFSSLYTMTTASPYLMWDEFMIPDFYYDNEENRFLYRTLYPREYTKLISDSVQHNLRFAANGMDDTTTMGRAVLATGGLLPWQRWTSNDAARLPREFNDLLNQQTEFQYSMVAILISATPPDAASKVKADHYKKFTATIYDFLTGKSTTARDIFILPKGQIFVWANGMFLYPVTKMKFYEGTSSYVIAYKVAYDYEEGDALIEDSVKSALMEKHNEIASACVNGFDGNGLLNYFDTSNDDFEGFKIPPGIGNEIGKEKIGLFYKSIDDAFAKYEAKADAKIPEHFPIKSMRTVCDEAIRGVGQISASAGLLNGYWLGITSDYLEK
jgi:hypothetical protein